VICGIQADRENIGNGELSVAVTQACNWLMTELKPPHSTASFKTSEGCFIPHFLYPRALNDWNHAPSLIVVSTIQMSLYLSDCEGTARDDVTDRIGCSLGHASFRDC